MGIDYTTDAAKTEETVDKTIPSWVRIAGLGFAILTLSFFAFLVFYREPLHDPDSRLPIITVLALGISLSSSFLGGAAAAEGKIRIAKQMAPVSFSATSGIGTFVVVFMLGLLANSQLAHYDVSPRAERLKVSFDVWSDLSREPELRNTIKLTNPYFAAVIYGKRDFDVRDIDISSVYAADSSIKGGGTRVENGQVAAMYYLNETYDENQGRISRYQI